MIFFFYKYTKESCNAASTGRHPGPQLSTFLCNWPCDGKIFHFPFIVYYDPSLIFKIKKQTIFSMVWLSLLNYHHWMYLLSELCFAFFDCGHHHVTHTSSRKSILSSLDPLHRDDTQTFGFCVVSTVDHGWLQLEDPKKSGILHQKMTHHILILTCWMLEKGQKGKCQYS